MQNRKVITYFVILSQATNPGFFARNPHFSGIRHSADSVQNDSRKASEMFCKAGSAGRGSGETGEVAERKVVRPEGFEPPTLRSVV